MIVIRTSDSTGCTNSTDHTGTSTARIVIVIDSTRDDTNFVSRQVRDAFEKMEKAAQHKRLSEAFMTSGEYTPRLKPTVDPPIYHHRVMDHLRRLHQRKEREKNLIHA